MESTTTMEDYRKLKKIIINKEHTQVELVMGGAYGGIGDGWEGRTMMG